MKKKFIIAFNDPLTAKELELLTNIISNNYVSITGGTNIILIASPDENESPANIYNKLKEKLGEEMTALIIVELKNWHGNLPEKAFAWLKEKFPESNVQWNSL